MRFLRADPEAAGRTRAKAPVKGPGKRPGKGPGKRPGKGRAGADRRARRGWRPGARQLLLGGALLCAMALIGAAVGAIQSGWAGRQLERAVAGAYGWTADAGLAVDQVLVAGRKRSSRAELLQAVGLARGAPLLAFDPWQARVRLEALPWVRRAEVQRHFPGVVFLQVEEREPLALWQLHKVIRVIDQSGEVIPGADPKRFAELPLLVGEDVPLHAARLLGILASEPDLERLVTAAVRVGGRRWNVQLAGGIDVQLPESGPQEAWAQLASIEREHRVLERGVVLIDLRLPDRLIIRTRPELPEEAGQSAAKNAGKST